MTQAEFSQGIELPHCTAYEAYQNLLRGLLLQEFPCGLGEWREDNQLILSEMTRAREKGVRIKMMKPNLTDYVSAVTLKDVNPGADRTETLRELTRAKESPWCQTCDWTEEGAKLRDLAITEPWTMTQKRINALLRTLKIHDKNVGEIDKKMKLLSNLEQLVISANYLTWIDGQNLPASLKMLELHGNFIDDLAGLLPQPPPGLEHLGVGRNTLAFVGDHLNGIYWPCLLSLDLSFNHLYDLKGLLDGIATLPKLRSLVLAGNPLALTPWYRGYTVDCLRKLLILDDAKVSADERHNYRGMVRRKEFLMDQCLLQIKVHTLKNLPVPPEVATPDEFPEYPVIQRKYYLRFWLPFEDTDPATATEGRVSAESADLLAAGGTEIGISGQDKLRKSAGVMSDIPEESGDDRDSAIQATAGAGGVVGGDAASRRLINDTFCSAVCSVQRTYAELASPVEPATANQIGWEGPVIRTNLRLMRDFLMHDVCVDIVEDKSLLYPPDQLPSDGQDQKAMQDKRKEEKKDDSKPKKKKKVDESSLVVHSTETSSLASIPVNLTDLLGSAGQWVALDLRSQTNAISLPTTVPSTPANADKRSKDNSKAKDDKAKKDKGAKVPPGSAKPTGKKAGKDLQTQASAADDADEGERQPPAVQAAAEVQRVQWRSVRDCPTAVVIAVDQK